jgi:hypothetical protein
MYTTYFNIKSYFVLFSQQSASISVNSIGLLTIVAET